MLELFDAAQQPHDTAGSFEHFWITLVVLKGDTCLSRHYPVEPRAPQEPENGDELHDTKQQGKADLEGVV